ncbi:precorrin-6y C5,15-methyltransferase (decarboxylating) subunit CbiE [Thaumasiovibrio sp. DFM-14]|uniref:precorrin-6y C5,15-methyltransferase (decarboxylating) subunit CbiE n=1 Tax=Thaumasiovibrio sp. DFM-14 TaxID=3384792 RepID=UPI0039A01BB7
MASISVIGVPEDGCLSLTSKAVNEVAQSRIIAGHPRHLAWFPQFQGDFLDMTQGFSTWLSQVIEESEEGGVTVLASGDPLFFGIGSTLLKHLPAEDLRFIPTQSSPQLAFSRLGIAWNQAQFLSVHGRKLDGIAAQMQSGNLFAILTDDKNTPQVLAAHLKQFNQCYWTLSVCEQLGGLDEKVTRFTVEELAEASHQFDKLNMVVAQRNQRSSLFEWGGFGQFAADSSFSKRMPKNGLITKQSVRNLALTQLKITPDDVVWDIGAGSGSIAIEAAKFAYKGQVFAVECNSPCFEVIEANCQAHATDNVALVKQQAPSGLVDLTDPNAVFVGGSRGAMNDILTQVWQRLHSNGRLVVSAVTVDTVGEVYQWSKTNNIEMDAQLIHVSHLQPLAHYQRYQADNPIHLFTFNKPDSEQKTALSSSNEQGETT